MEQRRNRAERTHRVLPALFDSLHAPPRPVTRTSASTEGGERASPVSPPHFGGTNRRCRSATTGRAWYGGTTTFVGHGPAISLRRLRRRCEIFGRSRTQMGDWPAPSISANSTQRRQCPVANSAPRRVDSAFMWRARVAARRAVGTRWQAGAGVGGAHNLLANAALQIGDAQIGVLRVGVREYPIGIKVA
jgi:hypothetical protein